MRLRGLGRLKMEWAKLLGRLVPGPMVLIYHRVANLDQDPHLLAVTPTHFEEHLQVLRQNFKVISLSKLIDALKGGGHPGPLIAVTFDDGYADNAESAWPLLKKYALPATFYLASDFVGSMRENLQDDLERLLLLSQNCPEALYCRVGDKMCVWSVSSPDIVDKTSVAGWNITSAIDPTPRHRIYREVHELLRTMSPEERKAALEQLRIQCGNPGTARSTHRAMSWDQVRMMADCELIEIGVHTVNHPWLSALSPKDQYMEIKESKRIIEEQIERSVASFAYPYGTRQSYTSETVSIVKELKFKSACSNFRERIDHKTDNLQIPRFVVRNWDGDMFLRQIRAGRL